MPNTTTTNKTSRNPMQRSSQWGETATRIQLEPFLSSSSSSSSPRPLRRLVIFAGPHKSASTSIQKFFTKHAGNQHLQSIHESFQDWIWPYEPFGQHPGSYNDFVVNANYNNNNNNHNHQQQRNGDGQSWQDLRRAELYFTISFVWEHHNRKNYHPPPQQEEEDDGVTTTTTAVGKNIVLGSEELDRIPGQTPWSGRNGIRALDNLVRLLRSTTELPPEQVDIVINYRTPRAAHWMSIWKQLTQSASGASSYHDLVGQSRKTYEHLNSVANPLALAYELRRRTKKKKHRRHRRNNKGDSLSSLWNVTLIDMGGVEKAGLDISHVIACQVLNVPCSSNGFVQGLEHKQLHSNQRDADPGLTLDEWDELEWLFRQRDCAYAQDLLSDPGVTVLYRDTLWEQQQQSQYQPPPPQQQQQQQHQPQQSQSQSQQQNGGEYCHQYDPELQQTLRHNGTLFLHLVQAQVWLGPGAGRPEYNISTLRDESLLRQRHSRMMTTTNNNNNGTGSTLLSSPWWKIGGPPSTTTTPTTRTSRKIMAPMDIQALTFPLSSSSATQLEYHYLTYIGIFQNVALVLALIVALHHIGVRRRRRR